MKLSLLAVLAASAAASAPLLAAPAKGLTIDDMLAMQRLSDPQVSPDGKRVVFQVRTIDVDENAGHDALWLATTDASELPGEQVPSGHGTGLVHLTSGETSDTGAQWTKDGAWLYFLSTRSGSPQVWRISPSGGEAQQITKLPIDLNGFTLFPDGKHLALAADVWPDAKSIAESAKRDRHEAKSKVKAQVYDQLLFRHWDTWEDGKYSHVFVWTPPELGGHDDDAHDLTPGQTTDTPVGPFGDMSQVQVSPDGKWIAYVARMGGREQAWTTNTDVFLVPSIGGRAANLTVANKAYDDNPRFSPDGKTLAITMMKRPGFESDRTRLGVIDVATHQLRVVTEGWDRSAGELVWAPDGKTIYTASDNVGQHSIFAIDVASGTARTIVDKGTNESPRVAGDRLLYVHDELRDPAELYSVKLDGEDARKLTHVNDARVAAIAWGDPEQFTFKGAKGDVVYGYAIKPANYVAGQKYPVAFLIHGGPQGSFGDHFHYRWNPEVFAGHGYGVVMIDFHGSTGYGQAFTDAISGDWGGAPYDDLMMGLDAALAKYSWLDGNRAAALGASFGGYMINWINGKTDRFKALVVHDGNNDERAAYLMTEELWFPEWEHGGTPWEHPEGYAKHEPFDLIKNWKTPTLVIHGGRDYRIPDTAGMGTFTALQRKGVPSRFLYFPDENHWVLKPQNSKLWHEEVFRWIDAYTKRR